MTRAAAATRPKLRYLKVVEPTCPLCRQPISAQIQRAIDERAAELNAETAKTVRAQVEAEAEARHLAELLPLIQASAEAIAGAKAETESAAAEKRRLLQAEAEHDRSMAAREEEVSFVREQLSELVSERDQLRKKLTEAQRVTRSPYFLGDLREWDVGQALRDEFSKDDVARVGNGRAGGDFILTVKDAGVICGRVLIEVKNSTRWSTEFVSKLLDDGREQRANALVLVPLAFQSKPPRLGLYNHDGVWVVRRSDMIGFVHLLREKLVRERHLSEIQRAESDAVFQGYFQSDEYRQAQQELEQLDAQEIASLSREREAAARHFRERESRVERRRALHREIHQTNIESKLADLSQPRIVAPAPGSRVDGWPINFSWTPGAGAEGYCLAVSTSPIEHEDTADYSSRNLPHDAFSHSVSLEQVVADGQPMPERLYVTFWWQVEGEWSGSNYEYELGLSSVTRRRTARRPGAASVQTA